ncbi:YopX family protein [Bacillus atrophaeus]|uniref:YopX family protein n=1 Tax=Bacillus atrophaeus TaxID=1452 RepID=UPI000C058B0E|nr:hypothetical protein RA13_13675 [Bacillus atrophaeus]
MRRDGIREIKFRAWDENSQEMIYEVGITPEGIPYSIPENTEECDQFNYFPCCHKMQYTGLKDKNGTELYEGDGFTAKHRSGKVYKGQVKFDLSFVFDIKDFEELFINRVGGVKSNRTFDIHSFIKWFDEVEVIGDIYRNTELIE